MEEEYFGVVRWCREDLIEALDCCCIDPTEEAVSALYERVNTHWFTELMTEHGWSFIFSCMSDLVRENKLKRKRRHITMNKTIHVLVIEPGKKPYEKDIGSDLESLQNAVGGYIQALYPYDEPVALICDEEGKLNGKEFNRALRDEDGDIYDVIAGTFLAVGLGEDDFDSLSPDLIEQFKEKFAVPEIFIVMNGRVVCIPVNTD